MKNVLSCSLLCIAVITTFSCKKSNDGNNNNTVNWKEKLKNTVWSGEFRYTTGSSQELQPFSMEINSNGTITWSDEGSTRDAGTWKVNGDTVTLTFPNQTTFTAIVDKDKWSNFSNQDINGFRIDNISAATPPRQSDIVNLTFVGVEDGKPLKLTFLPDSKLEITRRAVPTLSLPYTISGAGIRFERESSAITTDTYFIIFQNNMTTIKGYERENYFIPGGDKAYGFPWTANRQ